MMMKETVCSTFCFTLKNKIWDHPFKHFCEKKLAEHCESLQKHNCWMWLLLMIGI